MRRVHIALAIAALITGLSGCRAEIGRNTVAVQEVRTADVAWAAAFGRGDLDGYMGFVDSTAVILQPNGPAVRGAADIRALLEGFLGLPGFKGEWAPTGVDVAASGDLAYTTGCYEMSYLDPSGRPVTERGKYLEVWRRQADGHWRMVIESFNSDLPLPGAPG